jgi:hypothetical protein
LWLFLIVFGNKYDIIKNIKRTVFALKMVLLKRKMESKKGEDNMGETQQLNNDKLDDN